MKAKPSCPRCNASQSVKAGLAGGKQRYKCKACSYHFTVQKLGKEIDPYYVIKALQLYLEGLSFREIERIIGVSHVTVSRWVQRHGIKRSMQEFGYRPAYRILSKTELGEYFTKQENLSGKGTLVTELGDKFMVIRWDRFR